MKILGLQKVSMVDYQDKVCAVIFLGGCNFRCPFCHNSGIVDKKYDEISQNEVFDYLESRKKLLDGVVVSGGEPTLNSELPLFIRRIKALGYSVKLDTNGTNPAMLKTLIEEKLVDYVAMDIKSSFDDYGQVAGVKVDTSKIKESLSILRSSGVSYELRTTIVNELHQKKDIEEMSIDLAGEKLLYLQRFVDAQTVFGVGLSAVPKEQAEEFKKILEKTIKSVVLRGY